MRIQEICAIAHETLDETINVNKMSCFFYKSYVFDVFIFYVFCAFLMSFYCCGQDINIRAFLFCKLRLASISWTEQVFCSSIIDFV